MYKEREESGGKGGQDPRTNPRVYEGQMEYHYIGYYRPLHKATDAELALPSRLIERDRPQIGWVYSIDGFRFAQPLTRNFERPGAEGRHPQFRMPIPWHCGMGSSFVFDSKLARLWGTTKDLFGLFVVDSEPVKSRRKQTTPPSAKTSGVNFKWSRRVVQSEERFAMLNFDTTK
ncbi:hypothetical protein K438DRAFT_1762310 [Mycena galopus ATCC 62051]|nr:hypothetical protein K438DRAFT_1762310 [Mycena galopus ATCC 62051]